MVLDLMGDKPKALFTNKECGEALLQIDMNGVRHWYWNTTHASKPPPPLPATYPPPNGFVKKNSSREKNAV